MLTNYKYQKWKKAYPPDAKYTDIETYIGMEIFPEDIELFSYILLPNTILYKDRVILLDIDGDNETVSLIKKGFDDWHSSHGGKVAQWITNKRLVSDIFLNSATPETSGATLIRIADLIRHNWEYFLMKTYPNKKFVVEIGDSEWEDPYVAFYQP